MAWKYPLAMTLFLATSVVQAQAPAPVPAPAAAPAAAVEAHADRAKAIAPFVNGKTICVACGDTSRIDLGAIETLAQELIVGAIDPDEQDEAKRDIHTGLQLAGRVQTAVRGAGLKDVYWVMDIDELGRQGEMMVIPAGEKAQTLAQSIRKAIANEASVGVHQDAVIIADPRVLAQLPQYPAEDLPELEAAFGASDRPVAWVTILPDMARTQLMQNARPLPPQLGGASLGPLIEAYRWMLVEMSTGPKMELRAVAEMADKASAQTAATTLETVIGGAKQMASQQGVDLTILQQVLAAKVQDNRLITTADAGQIRQLATAAGPSLRRARASAKQVMSASNMRQLLMGAIIYADDHKGAFPDKLEDLTTVLPGPAMPRLLVNPSQPKRKVGYVYVKPENGAMADQPTERLVLYEAFDAWPGGINVGFADGHVEMVRDEARAKALIEAAKRKD
jgi:prepilin-type processing-associated H-X9-DG protein